MGTTVTHTFSSGATISHSQNNTNNGDLAAAIDAKAPSTGITAKALSDRFATPTPMSIVLIPAQGSNVALSGTNVIFPFSETTIFKQYVVKKAGQEEYLCAIHVYVLDLTAGSGGTSFPRLSFYVNSTLIGVIEMKADDTTYKIENSNPIASPLFALSNGDQIIIKASCAADEATDGSARGVTATLWIKSELSS